MPKVMFKRGSDDMYRRRRPMVRAGIEALRSAGVHIAESPAAFGEVMGKVLAA